MCWTRNSANRKEDDMENENILIIKDLDVRLFTDRGELPVIDRLSLTLKAGDSV